MILLISRSAWVRLSRETGCARVVGSKKVDVYLRRWAEGWDDGGDSNRPRPLGQSLLPKSSPMSLPATYREGSRWTLIWNPSGARSIRVRKGCRRMRRRRRRPKEAG